MYDTLTCYVIEEGLGFVVVALVVLLFVITVVVILLWPLTRILAAVIRRGGEKVEVKIGDNSVGTYGAITALWIPATWLALVGAVIYGAWQFYELVDGYYAVNINASDSPTLERVREDLLATDQRTRVTVKIADSVANIRVQGTFEGKCVADVMDAICRVNYRELTCTRSYVDRSIAIDAASRRSGS